MAQAALLLCTPAAAGNVERLVDEAAGLITGGGLHSHGATDTRPADTAAGRGAAREPSGAGTVAVDETVVLQVVQGMAAMGIEVRALRAPRIIDAWVGAGAVLRRARCVVLARQVSRTTAIGALEQSRRGVGIDVDGAMNAVFDDEARRRAAASRRWCLPCSGHPCSAQDGTCVFAPRATIAGGVLSCGRGAAAQGSTPRSRCSARAHVLH